MANNERDQRGGNQGGQRNQGGNQGNRGGNQSKSQRGFGSMDEERQREIAAEGGRASHEKGLGNEFDSEEAREAGRKGSISGGGRRGSSSGSSSGSSRSGNL